ncbi:acyl carrier protein [Herbaspirillum sp. AP02]|uniref:acyl carrier protein n=1 Tax=unclassified Herbaspirillum TaxID=2624150 RepID=UPI0015D9F7B5|nr:MULTISPECIES: phosphopantetheine-binding protein [unclassified Herbaspirillum]MBG7620561.1 acyl carrier protein [Herbaspirillum sp. AP02]NZD68025.1 acyl carrier protein [Herbaspirillum sp. AP21]
MKLTYDDFSSILFANTVQVKEVRTLRPADLLSDIGIDSLGFATVLWTLEERFNIQVDDRYLQRLNDLSTVSDLIAVFAELGHEIEIEPTK